jgi:hypothetical protein
MFRFIIVPVELTGKDGEWFTTPVESERVIIHSPNYNSAAAEAESRWPGRHFSVTKLGRAHDVGAADVLPLTSGAVG